MQVIARILTCLLLGSTSKTDTLQMVIGYNGQQSSPGRLTLQLPNQRARDVVVVHLAKLLRQLKAAGQ
jgi:hypothetical protein